MVVLRNVRNIANTMDPLNATYHFCQVRCAARSAALDIKSTIQDGSQALSSYRCLGDGATGVRPCAKGFVWLGPVCQLSV